MRLVSKHSQGYKFGILYAKKNQTTENEFFQNQKESKSFREFLEWIGTIITLKGWEGEYTGGLDVKKALRVDQSIYTTYDEYEIMFHVSTFIPYTEDDEERDI